MIIDAHQHFWKYQPEEDSWLHPEEMAVIRRDFTPSDLKPILDKNHVDATVAVQVGQDLRENQFLLGLAKEFPFIAAVVGWIELKATNLQEQLEHLSSAKKLVGFRHILQAEPPGYMSDPNFIAGVRMLGQLGFTYDLLIYESQLDEACYFVSQLDQQKIIIDHLAKPAIREKSFKDWQTCMRKLSAYPNVYCKLSGIVTEASWSSWSFEDLEPYLQEVLALFGAKRCVFGSDWPVCTLAASYEEVIDIVRAFISTLSKSEQSDVMGDNCRRFYGID
ncbi:MAG: amidohydrolase family protein [Saprospiraceae bacterium]|nr:amidohydrolase family protein [Saprospiraceae bacterium]